VDEAVEIVDRPELLTLRLPDLCRHCTGAPTLRRVRTNGIGDVAVAQALTVGVRRYGGISWAAASLVRVIARTRGAK
jgi:hypothetical protein